MKKSYQMKISKLLNKIIIFVLFFVCFELTSVLAVEPVDIWKIEKIVNLKNEKEVKKEIKNRDILNQKINVGNKIEDIIIDKNLDTQNIKLAGLYDPAENGLSIDMWSNSDGGEIKNLMNKINVKKLSYFSEKILNIALLTNSYIPENNISANEFLNFKFDYLKNKKDF